ncbi:MAG: hypothetical protein EOO20_19520 [Chryseobacterium sp.]|nr:MAG: hypothetical protein EOO20_19520 [Chryseobacterium sp.]
MITETTIKGKSNRKSVLPAVISASVSLLAIGLGGSPTSANSATIFSAETSEKLSGIMYKKRDEECFDLFRFTGTNNSFTVSGNSQINGFSTETVESNSFAANSILEPSEEEQNLYNYIACYIDQIAKNPSYITMNSADAFTFFYKSALKISKIPFKKAKVHLLPDNGLKFILKLSDSLSVQVSQSMIQDGLSSNEVVYSIFDKKQLIQSDISNINNFTDRVFAMSIA